MSLLPDPMMVTVTVSGGSMPRRVFFSCLPQENFFRLSALMPELMPSARVELTGFADDLSFNVAGQGEVHVIAAQHQMLTHGEPVEAQPLVALSDGDDREICGASSNVADQNHLAFAHAMFPSRLHALTTRHRMRQAALPPE